MKVIQCFTNINESVIASATVQIGTNESDMAFGSATFLRIVNTAGIARPSYFII
jgi:hypothetical protein